MNLWQNACSFIAGVISIWMWREQTSVTVHKETAGNDYLLVIGILSARDHFEERQAIRDTWMQMVTSNSTLTSRVLLKFIIGSSCLIPASDRLDPYGCEPWNIHIPESSDTEMAMLSTYDRNIEAVLPGLSADLMFVTRHPVAVGALGILIELLPKLSKPTRVKLLDSVSLDVIISATFSSESIGIERGGYTYKPVEQYILPKAYEASLLTDDDLTSFADIPPVYSEYNDNGILQLKGLKNDSIQVYTPVVSLLYTLQEFDNISYHLHTEETRREKYFKKQKLESHLLLQEAEEFHDIVFVDVVDVYRNLPQKLLEFLKWLRLNDIMYKYFLKTDDDCYVNVAAIVDFLHLFYGAKNIWFGNYREDWPVELYGKWAEHKYTGLYYPTFACGVGYVLSSDLTAWITDNADQLALYQGEDVSMGIWLSAVGPRYIAHPQWLCGKTCSRDLLAAAQLTASELRVMWNNVATCDNPCFCDEVVDTGEITASLDDSLGRQ